jgi:hypothetical protein
MRRDDCSVPIVRKSPGGPPEQNQSAAEIRIVVASEGAAPVIRAIDGIAAGAYA